MNLSSSTGLRFVLKCGAFVDVVLPLASAGAILGNFQNRHYHVNDVQVIHGTCLSGTSWAVLRDEVAAVHTVRLDGQPPKIKSLLSGNN